MEPDVQNACLCVCTCESLGIYFVGAFSEPALRRLLHQRTHWHAAADWWLQQTNMLGEQNEPTPFHDCPPQPFYLPNIEPPHEGIPVVYVIHSRAADDFYIGWTNNMPRRLARHRSGNAPDATLGFTDWQLKACVLGFYPTLDGYQETENFAKRYEYRLQHRWFTPHPNFDTILLAMKELCASYRARKNIFLWIDYA